MRTLDQRSPRRLGPLVVYEGAKKPSGETWFYGILVEPFEPATELVVRTQTNEEPVDPWLRRGPPLEGMAQGWWFHAVPREPGLHVLDLIRCKLTADERELLAFAVLNAAQLEHWQPPNWFPRLADAYVTFDGDVMLDAERRIPMSRVDHEPWRFVLTRQADAALLAGCLIGESTSSACVEGARALTNGQADHIALRGAGSALLIETIGVLLTPHTSRGPHLVPAIRMNAPSRDVVAAMIRRAAADKFAEAEAWHDARAKVRRADVEGIAQLAPAQPRELEKGFRLHGKYLVYGATRAQGRTFRAAPADGPFADLVAVPATTPNHDDVAFGVLVDPWGEPFYIDDSPAIPLAVREAAPLPFPFAESIKERVNFALHVARAVSFSSPLMEPSLEALSTTVDGRVCADGLEPGAPTLRFRGSPAAWRDAWATVIVTYVLGDGEQRGSAALVLGAIEEGEHVVVCGDAALDGALRAALLALTSDLSLPKMQAAIAAACTNIDDRLTPEDDPEERARISFVRRERARIVDAVRARPAETVAANASSARSRVGSPATRVTEACENVGYALAEAHELLRERWRRLRKSDE